VSWASKRETEISEGEATGIQQGRTLDDAFQRYEKELSAHKRVQRFEILRMGAIGRYEIAGTKLGDMKLTDITSDIPGRWRDQRLTVDKVKGSSVNRDLNLNLLSHVFASATKEWKWIDFPKLRRKLRRSRFAYHAIGLVIFAALQLQVHPQGWCATTRQ
jgi:hypothetical protein